MKLAVLFGILTLFFLVLIIAYFDLLLFFFRERKAFEKRAMEREYLAELEKRQKRKKHPQKKNLLLYLICLTSAAQGYENKAKRLFAFVRTDLLLGIYPNKNEKES